MTYHYTYKISFETGHVYFGVRSCECLPEEDTYMGSPVTFKNYWEEYEPRKVILRTFDTRDEANDHEDVLIEWAWSVNRALSLNGHIRNSKFNNYGKQRSEQAIKSTIEKNQKSYYVVNPEGLVLEGVNLKEFCRENGLHPGGMVTMHLGKILHWHGWTNSLETHILYLKAKSERGIYFCNTKKRWYVKYRNEENKKIGPSFKELGEAKIFRDDLEKQGHQFNLVRIKNWKEVLKQMEN
jgi:hypothetical protein